MPESCSNGGVVLSEVKCGDSVDWNEKHPDHAFYRRKNGDGPFRVDFVGCVGEKGGRVLHLSHAGLCVGQFSASLFRMISERG